MLRNPLWDLFIPRIASKQFRFGVDDDPPVLIGERYCLACHSWPSTELMIHVVWLVVGWTFWVTYMNSPNERWPRYTLEGDLVTLPLFWKSVAWHQARRSLLLVGRFGPSPERHHEGSNISSRQEEATKKESPWVRRFGELVMKSWRDLTSTNFCTDASWKLLEVGWKFQQLQLQLCHIPRLWQLLKLTVEVFRLCMPKSKVL